MDAAHRSSLAEVAALCQSTEDRLTQVQERLALSMRSLQRQAPVIAEFRRRLVREMLSDGRLPSRRPVIIFSRARRGERCSVCGRMVWARQQVVVIRASEQRAGAFLEPDCLKEWKRLGSLEAAPGGENASQSGRTPR